MKGPIFSSVCNCICFKLFWFSFWILNSTVLVWCIIVVKMQHEIVLHLFCTSLNNVISFVLMQRGWLVGGSLQRNLKISLTSQAFSQNYHSREIWKFLWLHRPTHKITTPEKFENFSTTSFTCAYVKHWTNRPAKTWGIDIYEWESMQTGHQQNCSIDTRVGVGSTPLCSVNFYCIRSKNCWEIILNYVENKSVIQKIITFFRNLLSIILYHGIHLLNSNTSMCWIM